MNRKDRKNAAKLRRSKRKRRFTFDEINIRAYGGTLIYRDGWTKRLAWWGMGLHVVDHTAPRPNMVSVERYSPTPADFEAKDWRLEHPPRRL